MQYLTSSSSWSGNRPAKRIGTGASRMIEPLPLARPEGSPEVLASPVRSNRLKACCVVMPMSKHVPLTEYLPVPPPLDVAASLIVEIPARRADAVGQGQRHALVSSVHSPGARPKARLLLPFTSSRSQPIAALAHDLCCHLLWIVAARKPDQRLAVPATELTDFRERMTRPADRQQDHSYLGTGHKRLKSLVGFMLFRLDPEQF